MQNETHYKLLNCWEAQEIPPDVSLAERRRQLERISVLSDAPFKDPVCTSQTDMPLYEETIVMICWLVFFAIPLWGPFVLGYVVYVKPTYGILLLGLAGLIPRIPSPHNPKLCYHYLASLTLKYFSFRAIWKNTLPKGTYIGVTPPHGLFPIAGMLGVFALPRFGGWEGRGAAANAVLNVPVVGNLLRALGCVQAERTVLDKLLKEGETIGISSGGIAEIFETNSEEGTETIILRSRRGIARLALHHGVPIIPGYFFGNSKALNVWYDKLGLMQWLSRKLRVSLVFFSGRFGLPIPYRTPLLAVFGAPFPVKKNLQPTDKDISEVMERLEREIKALFDTHKTAFGWGSVKLIVK